MIINSVLMLKIKKVFSSFTLNSTNDTVTYKVTVELQRYKITGYSGIVPVELFP